MGYPWVIVGLSLGYLWVIYDYIAIRHRTGNEWTEVRSRYSAAEEEDIFCPFVSEGVAFS